MKRILPLLVILGCLNFSIFAQEIFLKSPGAPNFREMQKDLRKFEKEQIKEKKQIKPAAGKEKANQENDDDLAKVKRWENFWQHRVSDEGYFPKPDYLQEETKRYFSKRTNERKAGGPNWSFMGPSTTPGAYRGLGRIACIAFHPTNVNTFWIGSPDAGIWKTTNSGLTWTCSTDAALPVLGVSDIAINPNHPDTMYIATGDGDFGSFRNMSTGRTADTHSLGVLMSTDGGLTWNSTGLSWTTTQLAVMRRIIISPTNPNVLLVASSAGVYRTANAGQTWTMVSAGDYKDLAFKPGDANTVYAASYGSNAQVFRSTNGGQSFTQASNFSGLRRIALGTTAANPNIVDAFCSTQGGEFGGLFRSTNSGSSFNVLYADQQINLLANDEPGTYSGKGQGWYDLTYAISPTNQNNLFIGGVNNWNSTDGGNTWNIKTMWTSGLATLGEQEVHADKHWFAYNPHNPSQAFQTNDGGIYYSNDGGTSWIDISNGLAISMVYRLSCSATNPNAVVIGMQDNGSRIYDGTFWNDATGGDGMNCLIDPVDSSLYTSSQYGSLYKDYSIIADQSTGPMQGGEWITPFVLDPNNHNIIFAGFGDVFKSSDQGFTWDNLSNGSLSFSNIGATRLAVAPSNSNIILAGDLNNLYLTKNGGTSWQSIHTGLPSGNLSDFTFSETNANVIWVTFCGFNSGKKVYQSIDGGSSWTNVSDGLPNVATNCIVYDKKSGSNRVFVGTDLGVFYRDDAMLQWEMFGSLLPNVIVSDLDIQYSSYKMRAGTYGRGVWEIDLGVPISPVAHFNKSGTSICQPLGLTFTNASSGNPTSYKWNFGSGASPATANTMGPHLVTYSSTGAKLIKLVVSNNIGTDSISQNITVNIITVTPVVAYNDVSMLLSCTAIGSFTYAWQINGSPVSGATNSTLQLNTSSTSGNYTCIITDGNGCTAVSNVVNVKIKGGAGILSLNNEAVSIYPNPANTSLSIHQNVAGYVKSVVLISITGQHLATKQIEKEDEMLDLSKYPEGIYFVKLEVPNGFMIKKLQVKH